MPRITHEQAVTTVTDIITGAGGEISHDELVAQATDQGGIELAKYIPTLKRTGVVKARVTALGNGEFSLMYSLP